MNINQFRFLSDSNTILIPIITTIENSINMDNTNNLLVNKWHK